MEKRYRVRITSGGVRETMVLLATSTCSAIIEALHVLEERGHSAHDLLIEGYLDPVQSPEPMLRGGAS